MSKRIFVFICQGRLLSENYIKVRLFRAVYFTNTCVPLIHSDLFQFALVILGVCDAPWVHIDLHMSRFEAFHRENNESRAHAKCKK